MSKIDIHISAEKVSATAVDKILALGFGVDHFQNCQNSSPPSFHATYRGRDFLPNDSLWQKTTAILRADPLFSGIVEEESLVQLTSLTSSQKFYANLFFDPLAINPCPASVHKACDVHIRVHLDRTSSAIIAALEALHVASFEREHLGVPTKVFTVTFPTLTDGSRFYGMMANLLKGQQNLVGQIKLEAMTRFMRRPPDALTLPITYSADLDSWLERMSDKNRALLRGQCDKDSKEQAEGVSWVV